MKIKWPKGTLVTLRLTESQQSPAELQEIPGVSWVKRRSPALLDVAHSLGELLVPKALQYGLHGCLGRVEAGRGVGWVFQLRVAGDGRLCCLQGGPQICELLGHVEQLRGGGATDGGECL